MRKTLLYATAIVLIVIILVVALTIMYYPQGEYPTFPIKGNINPPFNQAEIVLKYKGDWIGGYSFEDSTGQEYFKQLLNGTGNMQLMVNRPSNTIPWRISTWIQGFSKVQGNLTLSLFLENGTLIDMDTSFSSRSPPILSLNVNMDNLTSSHSTNGA